MRPGRDPGIPVVIEERHSDPLPRLGSQQICPQGVDRPIHFYYIGCTEENRPNDPTQGGERSQVRRKTARNPYTCSGLEHIQILTFYYEKHWQRSAMGM